MSTAPYYIQQAQDALDQASRVDPREPLGRAEVQTVLAFAQVYATLAVADATERQTRAINHQTETLDAIETSRQGRGV